MQSNDSEIVILMYGGILMEIRELRYFLAVARENSITLAAESLNISQPGLSKVIMTMEEQLGTKLFIRENRKITLTEDGILLRKRAQEIIDLVDKAEAEFSENEKSSSDITGDVYIGGGETEGMRFIAKTVKKLTEKYPNIHYHLYSGNADDVTERLDKGLLDFGILCDPADIKKYDFLRLPAFDNWGLLMRKDSPLAKHEFITPTDLIGVPLLCSRQSLVKNEISAWLGSDFEKLNIVSTYNLLFNASLLVDEGVGYALCFDKLINTDCTSDLCFRPLKPTLKSNLVIVWKKYQVFPKATQKFLEQLQQEINIPPV